MAILSIYEATDLGLTASEAYTKLSNFYVDNIGQQYINVMTESFFNTNARNVGKLCIGKNSFLMPYTETFTFADIYAFIKAQPEFVNPTDC